jgi:hypothetical protein
LIFCSCLQVNYPHAFLSWQTVMSLGWLSPLNQLRQILRRGTWLDPTSWLFAWWELSQRDRKKTL